ncbi:hypothetical protein [Burkholderia multivorans]|uniref:hypothetical protein n=1 Tax=Burkholderia multivorans TaxID=87883 RepID=UPI0012D2B8E8|nr:hypothetical protein [Burkholderia multivorans]
MLFWKVGAAQWSRLRVANRPQGGIADADIRSVQRRGKKRERRLLPWIVRGVQARGRHARPDLTMTLDGRAALRGSGAARGADLTFARATQRHAINEALQNDARRAGVTAGGRCHHR